MQISLYRDIGDMVGVTGLEPVRISPIVFETIAAAISPYARKIYGGQDRNRTCTDFSTTLSTLRVYQLHHMPIIQTIRTSLIILCYSNDYDKVVTIHQSYFVHPHQGICLKVLYKSPINFFIIYFST